MKWYADELTGLIWAAARSRSAWLGIGEAVNHDTSGDGSKRGRDQCRNGGRTVTAKGEGNGFISEVFKTS